MAGDPFGLLLRQRIVFLGGEVRTLSFLTAILNRKISKIDRASFFSAFLSTALGYF
jgi:hypothetical protein